MGFVLGLLYFLIPIFTLIGFLLFSKGQIFFGSFFLLVGLGNIHTVMNIRKKRLYAKNPDAYKPKVVKNGLKFKISAYSFVITNDGKLKYYMGMGKDKSIPLSDVDRIDFIQDKVLTIQRKVKDGNCPECKSESATTMTKGFGAGKAIVGAVAVGPLGLLAGLAGSQNITRVCNQCGYQWVPGFNGDSIKIPPMNLVTPILKSLNEHIKKRNAETA
jgi:hypothetical protein